MTGRAQMADRQNHGAEGAGAGWKSEREVAPDHHRDDGCLIGLGGRDRADDLAILHHRDAIGDREDFGQPMRNEDDRGPLRAELAENGHEPVDLGRRQRRRRLVEDENAGIDHEGAPDLDDLTLRQRQLANRPVDVELFAELPENAPRAFAHRPVVDQQTARLVAEIDVLGGVEVGHQPGVLIDHGDAASAGIGGACQGHRHAGDADLAGVRPRGAGQHAHQGRLAGAVLADQRVNLAGLAVEGDIQKRLDARERLGYPLDRERRSRLLAHCRKRAGDQLKIFFSSSSDRLVSVKTPSARSGRMYFL